MSEGVTLPPAWLHRNEQHSSTSANRLDQSVSQPDGDYLKPVVLGLAVALAVAAGWTDWRCRRIPNWLTVPGLLVGIAANATASGLSGLKASLLGAGLGLLLLLPFVYLRSLGAVGNIFAQT